MEEEKKTLPDLIRKLAAAWLMAVLMEYFLLPAGLRNLSGLSGLTQMSLARVAAVTALLFTGMLLVPVRFSSAGAERWCITVTFAILAAMSLAASRSWPYFAICCLLMLGFTIYSACGWDASPEPAGDTAPEKKTYLWVTAALAVAFFLFVSAWTVCRIYSFSTPSFDFGIFSQMFYYMKKTGLPFTTVERDTLLSHFRVHVSPIYYLMLPFYWLVPKPATLQVLQAAVLASAVIPLWKLGTVHGLKSWQKMAFCGLLLLYPAYSGGASYDIHENCFLTPLILWLFYGIDKKNAPITASAAALTLLVKEDAAVYVAVIALWLLVRSLLRNQKGEKWGVVAGAAMLAVSIGWFFLVTGYLANVGDGVMTYRYNNFIYDGSGSLMTVIKAVMMNPMKAVYECVDPEKLQFIALTVLPLLGLPFLTRRYERYLLLIPYLLVNLMSDYQYQHDIFFQYTYGATACMFYLAVVNLADFRIGWQKLGALAVAGAVSVGCFCANIVPVAVRYPRQCAQYSDYYQSIRDALDTIPQDASVATYTFYSTYLSQRDQLYDLYFYYEDHLLECDYVVIGEGAQYKRFADSGGNGKENLKAILRANEYEIYQEVPGVLTIYVNRRE